MPFRMGPRTVDEHIADIEELLRKLKRQPYTVVTPPVTPPPIPAFSGLFPATVLVTLGGPLSAYGTVKPPWFPLYDAFIGLSRIQVGTVGSGTVEIDFLKNGVSIYGTRPTIAAGSSYGIARTPDVTSWVHGDRLELKVLQHGSAGDLLFEMDITRNL